jgi:hypothetical protein
LVIKLTVLRDTQGFPDIKEGTRVGFRIPKTETGNVRPVPKEFHGVRRLEPLFGVKIPWFNEIGQVNPIRGICGNRGVGISLWLIPPYLLYDEMMPLEYPVDGPNWRRRHIDFGDFPGDKPCAYLGILGSFEITVYGQ